MEDLVCCEQRFDVCGMMICRLGAVPNGAWNGGFRLVGLSKGMLARLSIYKLMFVGSVG